MIKKNTILCVILILICPQSFAAREEYTLEYGQHNKVPGPSLAMVSPVIQLHANGNKIRNFTTHTDHYGKFILDNQYGSKLIVHVLSIKETKKGIRCRGVNLRGSTLITIHCYRLSDRPLF